jgi:hypothetical protein
VYSSFRWGNLRIREHLEDPGVDERILIRIFRKRDMGAWAGSIWFGKGAGGWKL